MPRVLSAGVWTVPVAGCTGIPVLRSDVDHGLGDIAVAVVGLAVSGNYAFSVVQDFGTPRSYVHKLVVFNTSNPDSPTIASTTSFNWGTGPSGGYFILNGIHPELIDGTTLYCIGEFVQTGGSPTRKLAVRTIDISDPTAPSSVGGYEFSLAATSSSACTDALTFTSGGQLYIVSTIFNTTLGQNIVVIEASPATGTIVSNTALAATQAIQMAYRNSNVYAVQDGSRNLSVLDVSNPASPSLTTHINFFANTRQTGAIANGDVLWVADYLSGVSNLIAVDISTPAGPSIISTTSTSDAQWRWDICAANNFIEILNVGTNTNITDWDVSNPNVPTSTGTLQISADDGSNSQAEQIVVHNAQVHATFVDYTDNIPRLLTFNS